MNLHLINGPQHRSDVNIPPTQHGMCKHVNIPLFTYINDFAPKNRYFRSLEQTSRSPRPRGSPWDRHVEETGPGQSPDVDIRRDDPSTEHTVPSSRRKERSATVSNVLMQSLFSLSLPLSLHFVALLLTSYTYLHCNILAAEEEAL